MLYYTDMTDGDGESTEGRCERQARQETFRSMSADFDYLVSPFVRVVNVYN